MIINLIREISGHDDITPDMTLRDLDIDAIDLAYLALSIEDAINTTITHDQMTAWETVDDVLRTAGVCHA